MPKSVAKRTPKRICNRHDYPCTCAMGHLNRFVEPVLLLVLKQNRQSYGYDLLGKLAEHAFTDGKIEKAVLYRTLHRLEQYGYIDSDWETGQSGPARRVYILTKDGHRHLKEWAEVLAKVAASMTRFVHQAWN